MATIVTFLVGYAASVITRYLVNPFLLYFQIRNLLKKTDSNCIIISVDDWLGDWGSDDSDDTDGDDVLYNTFIANTWNNKNRVIPIKTPNLEIIDLLVKLKIQPDIIFVNKRQNYESVYDELELLIKHFSKSIIIGNNIMNVKSVSQAVKDLIKDYDLSNVETNLNSYVIVPQWYTDKFKLKELKIKTIKPLNQYNPSKVAIIAGFKKEIHSKFVLTRFIDYMNFNQTLFPKYYSNSDDDIDPSQDAIFNGWVL